MIPKRAVQAFAFATAAQAAFAVAQAQGPRLLIPETPSGPATDAAPETIRRPAERRALEIPADGIQNGPRLPLPVPPAPAEPTDEPTQVFEPIRQRPRSEASEAAATNAAAFPMPLPRIEPVGPASDYRNAPPVSDEIRQATANLDISDATRSRYRLRDGEWWFETNAGDWKYFRDGRWRDFDPNTYEPPIRLAAGTARSGPHTTLRPIGPSPKVAGPPTEFNPRNGGFADPYAASPYPVDPYRRAYAAEPVEPPLSRREAQALERDQRRAEARARIDSFFGRLFNR